ncbi:D-aminopeptidase [Melghirimyces algeriensis]|uniref:D-aminopeptidase n=1 Tax=Melghirimyces algeriensis TaxID=910412 RepID=A0A521FA64_9BACL|nr:D-aminopeptidase [Melghirimyces algeriensis]
MGRLPSGSQNCITDVTGVRVGHITLKEADQGVCTGVTAILPHDKNPFLEKTTAVSHVINGFSKTTGLIQVDELGVLESPILLTNTFGVPAVTEGALQWLMEKKPEIGDTDSTVNIVTAECNDGWLNDLRGLHLHPDHAIQAIQQAEKNQLSEEGAIGAGAGMISYGWKGGIGTASRRLQRNDLVGYIEAMVLTNFGKPEELTILGVPMNHLKKKPTQPSRDGSVIVILATDLPFSSRQLKRLAKRTPFGLARTGSMAHHGSGEIVIAFSNAERKPHRPTASVLSSKQIAEDGPLMTECFQAVVEATEEAVYNSLFAAETTFGRNGRYIEALPHHQVIQRLKQAKDRL